MNLIKKSFVAGALALTLVGCKTEFAGKIDVSQKMTVKIKNGTANIGVGSYGSTLKFSSKKKATLVINQIGQKSLELPLTIPENSMPEDNGPISLKAEEINQTFDVDGVLKTLVTESNLKRGTESCTEHVRYTECYYDPQGRPYCREGWRAVSGVRDINYFERYFTRSVELELRNAMSGQKTAQLSGKNVETEKVVTQVGFCRAYSGLYTGMGRYVQAGAQFLLGR